MSDKQLPALSGKSFENKIRPDCHFAGAGKMIELGNGEVQVV